jgi:hypothetical protein
MFKYSPQRRGIQSGRESLRADRLSVFLKFFKNKVDGFFDVFQCLRFGISPGESARQIGTVRTKSFPPILEFIRFDDDFKNVAFQIVLLRDQDSTGGSGSIGRLNAVEGVGARHHNQNPR